MATKTIDRNAKPATRKNAAATARPNRGRRPAVRRVQQPPSAFARVLRANLHWFFLCVAAILVGVVLFVGYQRATASSVFDANRIDVAGAIHTKADVIEKNVRALVADSGVWNADLSEIKRQIEQSTWVKSATVSRVLPDGLRVRIVERLPRAVVKLQSGAKVWVDDEARILGEPDANEKDLPLVLQGWNESKDPEATRKNQDRLQLYLKLQNEFRQSELAARITALNLTDVQDIVAINEQNNRIVEINLGNKDFSQRLKTALDIVAQREELKNAERVKIINYDGHPVVSFKQSGQSSEDLAVNNGNQRKTVR